MAHAAHIEEIYASTDWRLGETLMAIGLNPVDMEKLTNDGFLRTVQEKAAERRREERSALDDILMQPLVLKLAGREYEVHPHKIADEQRWLKALGAVAGIVGGSLGSIVKRALDGDELDAETIDYAELLEGAMPRVISMGVPAAIDLMFSYSAQLKEDRAYIEENSSLMERMEAALEVVQLAFPQMLALMKKMMQLVKAGAVMRAS